MIQSIPIFDETKLFTIHLPKSIGVSISFSYFLCVYLVLMILGKSPEKWNIYLSHKSLSIWICVFAYHINILSPATTTHTPLQAFLSTFVISTSKGRGVSAPRRGKQIEIQHQQQHSSNTFAACLFLDKYFWNVPHDHSYSTQTIFKKLWFSSIVKNILLENVMIPLLRWRFLFLTFVMTWFLFPAIIISLIVMKY